jgi:uncharacterized protein (DUF302 family)
MGTFRFEVERIDVPSKKSFSEMIAALEEHIPSADFATFAQMVSSRLSAQEIARVVDGMVRDLGFLVLAKIEQGPLVSLLGKPKKLSVFLIGNPVLANRMFEHNPAVGLYAPLRVSIYEDAQGTCHFTYDRPSALLEQFGNEEIRAVARILDQRMEILADRLSR